MSINLDAIKKRLSTLQTTAAPSKKALWRPEAGKSVIRIVPYQFNKDNPFIELYFHYELGKKSYLSLETFGESDPVVEFSEKLKKTGIKEDWVLGRKLEPTLRTYVPVIVRGKEKEGVKFWGFGKNIYQELLAIIADPDYGDITDLKSGRDITVESKTPAEAGNQYGSVSIRIKPNASPATDEKEVAQLILNGQTNIFDLYAKSDYNELKEALEAWLNPTEENEVTGEVEVEKTEPKPEPAKETPKVEPTKAVDDLTSAFDDIFN